MKHKILLPFFILFINIIFSQTKVTGVVLDEKNKPISYCTVAFKGTSEGIDTDENGKFILESKSIRLTLAVAFIGYITKNLQLNPGDNLDLKIILKEDSKQLDEVVLVRKPKKHLSKKENPAYRILKGIWANKKKNGLNTVPIYDYKRYTSVAVGLSNMDSISMKKILGKAFDSIIDIIEKKKKLEKYFVPIYMKETNEAIYGNNKIKKEKVDKLAERNIGVGQQGFLFDRISNTFQAIDIYENDISILNKNFISPISERGYGVYEYVLKDSIVDENNKKTYSLYFFPRQAGDLVFEGNMKVRDKSFAVTDISMRVNRGINLNLVRDLAIEKEFKIENDSLYLPLRDYYEGDFTLLTKSDNEKGMFVRKNIVYNDYDFETKHDESFYDEQIIQTRGNQFNKENEYWNSLQTRDTTLVVTRKIIGDLKNNKKVKAVSGFLNVLSTGFFEVSKNLQFGSFWNVISNNDVEGLRLRAGFRTFKTVDDLFRVNFYGAFGTLDKKFKYGIEARYLISSLPRVTIGLSQLEDNIQFSGVGLDTNGMWSGKAGTNILIARGVNNSLARVERNAFNVDLATNPNLHFSLSGTRQKLKTAADPEVYNFNYDFGGDLRKRIIDFSTSLSVIYTPQRINYGFGVDQRFGRSLFSTFIAKYTRGISGVMGSQFNYNKLQLGYNKPLVLSNFGQLNCYFEVGKTFDALPLPLLNPVPANQSFSNIAKTFCLINFYDMVTDNYAMAHFDHHLNGLIFNRVPGLKKLNLREVLFYRTIVGSISDKNIAINRSTINYLSPTKAYSEFGFGIENIGYGNFRPFRIDFVWRNDFQNINGPESPKFGIRVDINPEF